MTGAGRSAPRPRCSRTSAGTSSTTCRPRCCADVVELVDAVAAASSQPDRGRGRRARPARSSPTCQASLAAAARPAASTRACCSSRPPTTCWSAATRPPAARTRCRASGRLLDGIAARARRCWRDLRGDADLVIDTSRPQRAPARPPRSTPRSAAPSGAELRVTVMSLRLQVRHAGRRRLRRRHAVPAQPVLGPRAAAADRARRRRSRDYVLGQPGAERVPRPRTSPLLETVADGYLREGKRYMTVAVGCTGGKHRSVAMAEEIAAPAARRAASTPAPSTATWGASELTRVPTRPAAVVALGGGHGLRRVACGAAPASPTDADRGGDGRRRRRLVGPAARRVRRAAARATCGWRWPRCAATTSGASTWARRRSSTGSPATATLRGHAVGNLLIVALWELLGDPVAGLDWVGRLLGAQGRVLPMAAVPLDIDGRGPRARPRRPRRRARPSAARSQVATTPGPGRVGRASCPPTRRPAPRRSTAIRERRLGRARARARGSPP